MVLTQKLFKVFWYFTDIFLSARYTARLRKMMENVARKSCGVESAWLPPFPIQAYPHPEQCVIRST